jgi:nucleoporin NUP82
LLVAETITLKGDETPTFNQSITPDVHTDFSFFVSSVHGVAYISLEPWIRKLENELSEPQTEGAEFRLQRLLGSANSQVEQYIERQPSKNPAEQQVTSCVVIEDGNVGYLVLTTINDEPVAALLDAPEDGFPTEEEIAQYMQVTGPRKDVREAWQPPKELYEPFDLYASINIPARHRATLKEEIKLSPANLELLMDVHRVLSVQTEKLQKAVADLFNRATRLQEEFRDQVLRSAQIVPKIDSVTGADENSADPSTSSPHIDARLAAVKKRQDEINARYDSLRRKMTTIASPELSDKEAAWTAALQTMSSAVDKSARTLTDDVDGSAVPAWQRIGKLKDLQSDLSRQVKESVDSAREESEKGGNKVKVPSYSRKQETDVIQDMLQRNTDLVEAAAVRLEKLGVAVPREKVV